MSLRDDQTVTHLRTQVRPRLLIFDGVNRCSARYYAVGKKRPKGSLRAARSDGVQACTEKTGSCARFIPRPSIYPLFNPKYP